MSEIPELGIVENTHQDDSSLERENTTDEVTFGNYSTPMANMMNKKSNLRSGKDNASLSPPRKKQMLDKRNVSASPNPRSRPAWKRKLDNVVNEVTGFDG